MNQQSEIPYNWGYCKLSDVLSLKNGYAFKSSEYQDSGTPIIRISDIQNGIVKPDNAKYIYENNEFDNYKIISGDILIAMSGATTGKFGIYTSKTKSYQNQRVGKFELHTKDLLNNKFIYFLLHSLKRKIEKGAYGGAQPNISSRKIEKLEFVLPPLQEQHLIVNKIETLFSKLDKGIESLKTAQEQLKLYRQALLKHAFEGKLTEQWRKDNADKLETAEELLARIKQERENRYQQQLEAWEKAVEQWEAEGKDGKKPVKQKKLADLNLFTKDELASLPKIPFSWCWIKYGDLCSIVRNGISKKPIGEIGDKIFRISAVRPMFFNMKDYRILENKDGKYDHFHLLNGDLVFTRYNGTRKYVGVCAEYKSNEKRLFPDKLVQTRADLPTLSSSYLEKALNSGVSRKFIDSKIRTTAGQSGVSGGDIKNIPIAICSKQEQILISTYSEEKLSVINQLEKEIKTNLKKSQALRQSILKKAFSGKLVPQDPNDEPASELLKRIAIEKAEQLAKAKVTNKKSRKKVKSSNKNNAEKVING